MPRAAAARALLLALLLAEAADDYCKNQEAAETTGQCTPSAIIAEARAAGAVVHPNVTAASWLIGHKCGSAGDGTCGSPGPVVLYASGWITPGAPLWTVPEEASIQGVSAEDLELHPDLREATEGMRSTDPASMEGLLLAAALIRERRRGAQSAQANMIACLPAGCGSTVFCAGEDDVALAASPQLQSMYVAARKATGAAAELLPWEQIGVAPPRPTEGEVRWAVSVVARHALRLRPDSAPVLVPLAAAMPSSPTPEEAALVGLINAPAPSTQPSPGIMRLEVPPREPGVKLLAAAIVQRPRPRAILTALTGARHAQVSGALAAVERVNPAWPDAARQALIGSIHWAEPGAIHELPTEEVVAATVLVVSALCAALGLTLAAEHGAGMALLSALLHRRLDKRGIKLETYDAVAPKAPETPFHPYSRTETFAETLARPEGPRVWVISWLHPASEGEVLEGLTSGELKVLVLLGRPGGKGCQTREFHAAALRAGARYQELRLRSVSQSDWHTYPGAHSQSVMSVYVGPAYDGPLAQDGALRALVTSAMGEDAFAPPPPPRGSSARLARAVRTLAVTGRCPRMIAGVDLVTAPDEALLRAEPTLQEWLKSTENAEEDEGSSPLQVWAAEAPQGTSSGSIIRINRGSTAQSPAESLYLTGELCPSALRLPFAVPTPDLADDEVMDLAAEALRRAGATVKRVKGDTRRLRARGVALRPGEVPWQLAWASAAISFGASRESPAGMQLLRRAAGRPWEGADDPRLPRIDLIKQDRITQKVRTIARAFVKVVHSSALDKGIYLRAGDPPRCGTGAAALRCRDTVEALVLDAERLVESAIEPLREDT